MNVIRHRDNRGIAGMLAGMLLVYSFVLSSAAISVRGQSAAPAEPASGGTAAASSSFRIEKMPVAGGSEILTFFAALPKTGDLAAGPVLETPLVSVLRDTLGDNVPENDRLRYVWMLNYTSPSTSQKLAALVPFLYMRAGNKGSVGKKPPPPVFDIQASDKTMWNAIFWMAMHRFVLGAFSTGFKATASQYYQNMMDNRRSAIAGAVAVLALYREISGDKLLSDAEFRDIQATLSLSNSALGGMMQPENLKRKFEKDVTNTRDTRGHNWELLRQYAENQHLYFEPLEMPDGSATHAIVWTSKEDVAANKGKDFDRRFLNIKDPWSDSRLENWKGYTQERWYDTEDRPVDPGTPGAKSKTMIPLAIYGLDHPKIPIILIDFRDSRNPKRREMTRRVLVDFTGNILSLARFGGWYYFFGRMIYDFVTSRRGMDVNQGSRMYAYSQLKLLITLNASLDDDLRGDVEHRIGSMGINPLENDMDVESRIAREQYANLIAYAKRPDGLPAKVERDRRQEMVSLNHGRKDRTLFTIARVLSLGTYTHRETSTPELMAQLNIRRQLEYHERFISEVAWASAGPEIDANTTNLKRSLLFISEHGDESRGKTARSLSKLFAISNDDHTRSLCLAGLYRINDSSAKNELLAIYNRPNLPDRWHELSAVYLKLALEEGQRISARDAERITAIAAN